MQERLQKILAQATKLSRRAAEEAISKGFVKVNGQVVTKLGTKADPGKDHVSLHGKSVRPIRQRVYIAFNKPKNTMVTKSDPEERPLIWDRLHPDMKELLNSAGRLDFDSEGLLILTNDGELIHRLTHPKSEVWKSYYVKVSGVPSNDNVAKIKTGVRLEDGVTLPAKLELLRSNEKHAYFEISIREGRNRQIRRMFAAIGHPVSKLRRTAIGPIKIGSLKPGEYRHLTRKEIKML